MPPQNGELLTLKSIKTSCALGSFSPNAEPVLSDRWTYGALAEAGDTRYFEITASKVGDTVVLVDAKHDVDLYLREGEFPTSGTHDSAAEASGAGDMIIVPRGTGTFFVAVQAYALPTWYRIRTAVFSSDNTKNVKGGFASHPTPDVWIMANVTAKQARRRFFGLTNGQYPILKFDLYNEPSGLFGECQCAQGFCEVCFRQAPDRSFALPGNQVTLFFEDNYTYSDSVLAHEFGHSLLWFPDEYIDHPGYRPDTVHSDTFCNKSTMGNQFIDRLCVDSNHGETSSPVTHTCDPNSAEARAWFPAIDRCPNQNPGGVSMWRLLNDQFGLTMPQTEPENVSFGDFVWLDQLFDQY